MINRIIVCLLITSLLLLVLAFWRNSKASIPIKLIISSVIAAVFVFGIISKAEIIRADINNAKHMISDTVKNVHKAGTEKTASILNGGKSMIFNTVDSIRAKSLETIRSIITGDKAVTAENKEEDDKATKEENKDAETESEIPIETESESEAQTEATNNMPAEGYEVEKSKQTGPTKDESMAMLKNLNKLRFNDISNISVNSVGN